MDAEFLALVDLGDLSLFVLLAALFLFVAYRRSQPRRPLLIGLCLMALAIGLLPILLFVIIGD